MADSNNCAEPTLPTKRVPDPTPQDSATEPKKQKLESLEPTPPNDVVQKSKGKAEEAEEERKEEEGGLNGKVVIDRKGKGILIEEDSEDSDDSDDDSSDSNDDSDVAGVLSDESDEFVEDPLAEVDLDNILPSRTRRKTINPGAYLASDLPPEDSDESDDPDA